MLYRTKNPPQPLKIIYRGMKGNCMDDKKHVKRDVTELLEVNDTSYMNEMKRLHPGIEPKTVITLGTLHLISCIDNSMLDKFKQLESEIISMKYSALSLPGDTTCPEDIKRIRDDVESAFEACMYYLTYIKIVLGAE